MAVALTVSFQTGQFLTFIFAVLLQYRLMGQMKVNLYCIVTRKLKSYRKHFNLRVTMYVFAKWLLNIYFFK